jgi:hypothetical protein
VLNFPAERPRYTASPVLELGPGSDPHPIALRIMRRLTLHHALHFTRTLLLAIFVLHAVGCAGDDDGVTGPNEPAVVDLQAGSVASSALPGGAAVTAPITISRPSGFSGAVVLTAQAPTGITTLFSPSVLSGTATTSVLTIAAAQDVAPGTYSITVASGGDGVQARSVTLQSTVVAPPPPPDFTVSTNPAAISVQAGQATAVLVNVARLQAFTGPVTLAVSGAPIGLLTRFDEVVLTSNATLLVLDAVAGLVTPGTFTLTIRANGEGVGERTATLTVTVTPPPPPPPVPGFTIAASPSTRTVVRGQQTTYEIEINRTGVYNADILFTVAGVPTGVTATFARVSSGPAFSANLLTVVTTAAAVPGTYQLVVQANGSNVPERTAVITLVVSPPPGG